MEQYFDLSMFYCLSSAVCGDANEVNPFCSRPCLRMSPACHPGACPTDSQPTYPASNVQVDNCLVSKSFQVMSSYPVSHVFLSFWKCSCLFLGFLLAKRLSFHVCSSTSTSETILQRGARYSTSSRTKLSGKVPSFNQFHQCLVFICFHGLHDGLHNRFVKMRFKRAIYHWPNTPINSGLLIQMVWRMRHEVDHGCLGLRNERSNY